VTGGSRWRPKATAAALAAAVGLSVWVIVVGVAPFAAAGACNGAVHPPVLIASDADFTAANGIVSGAGTASSPYLIANLAIDDMSLGYGLKIDNSANAITKSFGIACISSNWKSSAASGGAVVWIVNVHTATTITLVLSNSGELPRSDGIRVDSSSNIVLDNENFNKMGGDGIALVGSDHITVIDSKSKAAGNGLSVVNSHDIRIGQTCNVGGGQGCDEFTYDDNHGLFLEDSYNVEVLDTITSSDDSGGILLSGSGTYNVQLTGGTATADGPICHAGTASGYVSDTITGVAVVDGAHDVTVHGYTMQANGDGGGGFFDIMDGGKGLYLSPCGGLTTLPATPAGGANLDFSGNCFRYEFGFNPAPVSACPNS
jgi:parallel beta-helix repeat protein